MDFLSEYGLLIAVAIPPGVVLAMNLYLLIGGEHATLLLPTLMRFPKIAIDEVHREDVDVDAELRNVLPRADGDADSVAVLPANSSDHAGERTAA